MKVDKVHCRGCGLVFDVVQPGDPRELWGPCPRCGEGDHVKLLDWRHGDFGPSIVSGQRDPDA